MNNRHFLLRALKTISVPLALSMSVSACVTLSAFGGTSWKEEVLLHDGGKIVVTRSVDRGGRHEIGQKPPYKEQSLGFAIPNTSQNVKWEDHFSEDLGAANFLPMLLDIHNGIAYLVVSPMGCLSYNKWGRPNPPYVIFKYEGKAWQRIPLTELPSEITAPNLISSSPDIEVEKSGKRFISAEMIKQLNEGYKQPEYRSILREKVEPGGVGSSVNCEEMIRYKCGWGSPGEFNKKYFENICK